MDEYETTKAAQSGADRQEAAGGGPVAAEGTDLQDVCRHLEVSIQTYQRWRSQYKAMRPEDVVRLKQLEKENARLKRMVAEQALDIDMLREVSRGNF